LDRSKINNIHLSSFQTHNYVNENIGFLKNPEFIFDDFIYHHHRTHLETSMDNLRNTMKQYSHLLNVIENRKLEREFDIASWGARAGRDLPCEIYLLEKMSR
jgi:hypothetical protein